MLVSDAEREHTVGLLHEHWVSGRLTVRDLETRSEEAWAARYVHDLWHAVRELPVPWPAPAQAPGQPPPQRLAKTVWSVVLGAIGATMVLLSFGMLFILSLPISATAWGLGRSVRRDAAVGQPRSLTVAGEVLGIVGTILGCLALAACSAIVVAA
jgi:hypothetical protein